MYRAFHRTVRFTCLSLGEGVGKRPKAPECRPVCRALWPVRAAADSDEQRLDILVDIARALAEAQLLLPKPQKPAPPASSKAAK